MDNNLAHNDWKDDAPHLARLPKVNPFTVPEQYFDTLSARINAAVFIDELKSKAGIATQDVPSGYFKQLEGDIYTRISLEVLNLPKEDGFAVPEGYFDQVSNNVLKKISQEQSETVKVRKLWPNTLSRYAAAACLALICGLAVYLNQDSLSNTTAKVNNTTVSNTASVAEDPMLWDIEEEVIMEQVDTRSSGYITNTSATSAELEDYILDHYTQYEIASNL